MSLCHPISLIFYLSKVIIFKEFVWYGAYVEDIGVKIELSIASMVNLC